MNFGHAEAHTIRDKGKVAALLKINTLLTVAATYKGAYHGR